MKKNTLLLISLTTLLQSITAQQPLVGAGNKVDPYKYTITKTATFNKASVASAHPLASMVGAAIMQQGGNAFDAAIATQLALAVVYPGAGNLGGGGFLLARKKDGNLIGLDYREKAPASASRDMYLDKEGTAQTTLSQNGHLSSGVPGTVAGLFATFPYAKLPFKTLIQPAIDLAEYGFVITEHEARSLNGNKADFIKYSTKRSAFIKDGEWKAGDTLIQKDLAETLKRIRDNGQKGFYEGLTAELIVNEMERGNGLITLQDLKDYSAKERKPVTFSYRGVEVVSFAPPSSGGILLAQMLKMAEKFPLNEYGFQSPKAVQLMVEVERRAYADRAQYMGDPDFWKVPAKMLMSDTYLTQRMQDYAVDKAGKSTNISYGILKESEETTHLSIMDAEGNMVAVTTTLNNGYGSKTVVGGAGFLLNDEMDDFSIKPGVPNMYGAIGGEANAIQPGKRMLSSMTPTLLLKDNKPFVVVGTPGGTTIPTSVFQSIVNVVDFSMNAEDAVNKPKFHHQWLPDVVYIEKTFLTSTSEALKQMGYTIEQRGAIGRTELIKINGGKLETAADKRGDDSVAGF
ncbi:gamma-glutamyltransferase [Danxiaibacter flavus]|uniref:Glutathione hydrolase proenzyme n=1 Tax=Danxiaibacter flavus TaxID=3049108 RepID=A0ABV3Z9L4_9BACT|nr:gamma-glutamyltransferase [Chitinophagaceae bacterium DXS]